MLKVKLPFEKRRKITQIKANWKWVSSRDCRRKLTKKSMSYWPRFFMNSSFLNFPLQSTINYSYSKEFEWKNFILSYARVAIKKLYKYQIIYFYVLEFKNEKNGNKKIYISYSFIWLFYKTFFFYSIFIFLFFWKGFLNN
jgi:hypothetical protein